MLGMLVAAAAAATCPPISVATQLPVRPHGVVLRGDVDGDGVRDVASVRVARAAPMTCGFFLVVRSRRTSLAVRLPEFYKPPNDWSSGEFAREFGEPYLMALVAVARRGLGILVARSHGASTTEATLFVVRRHRLVPLEFELGGSVGTVVQQVDCLRRRSGLLVFTSVEMSRWTFRREVDRLVGTRLRRLRARDFTVRAKQGEGLAWRWHVSGPPFASCTAVRGSASRSPISPKKSPGPSSRSFSPSLRTSAVPSSIAMNS